MCGLSWGGVELLKSVTTPLTTTTISIPKVPSIRIERLLGKPVLLRLLLLSWTFVAVYERTGVRWGPLWRNLVERLSTEEWGQFV